MKSNSKELNRLKFLNVKSNILKSMRALIGSQFCNRLFFFVLYFSFFFWPKASPLFFLPNFVFQTSQRQCKDSEFKLPRVLIPNL